MAFTKREKLILIFAIAAISLLVGDKYVLSPLLEMRAAAAEQRQVLEAELTEGLNTLDRRKVLRGKWQQMRQAGLTDDIEKTESTILRFLKESSYRNRLILNSLQPDRIRSEGQLGIIEFTISGTGDMDSVSRFLWELETTEVPIKVMAMQLGSSDEQASKMSLQLKMSAIHIQPKTVEN